MPAAFLLLIAAVARDGERLCASVDGVAGAAILVEDWCWSRMAKP